MATVVTGECREEGCSVVANMVGRCIPSLQGWVWSLASDPTTTSLLCSSGWDNKVLLWDVAAGQRAEFM